MWLTYLPNLLAPCVTIDGKSGDSCSSETLRLQHAINRNNGGMIIKTDLIALQCFQRRQSHGDLLPILRQQGRQEHGYCLPSFGTRDDGAVETEHKCLGRIKLPLAGIHPGPSRELRVHGLTGSGRVVAALLPRLTACILKVLLGYLMSPCVVV